MPLADAPAGDYNGGKMERNPDKSPTSSAWRGWLRSGRNGVTLALGAALSAGFIAIAFRGTDWRAVVDVVRRARVGWLLLALGSVLVTAWWRARRWRLLLIGPGETRIGVGPLLAALWVGQALNALTPARLGEVARALLIAQRSDVGRGAALWSLVMEKLLDTLTLLAFVAGLALGAPLPAWLRSGALTLGAATLVLLIGLLAVERWRQAARAWLERLHAAHPRAQRLRLARLLEIIADSARLWRDGRTSARLALWSLGCFLAAASTNALTALALGISLPPTGALLLLAVLQSSAVAPLPTLPGRAGLFHLLCVLTLEIYGLPPDAALGYALVLHLLVYLPMALGGPAGLWWLRRHHALRG